MDATELRLSLLRLTRVLYAASLSQLRLGTLPALQAEVAERAKGDPYTHAVRIDPPPQTPRAFAYWFDGKLREAEVLALGLEALPAVLDELDGQMRSGDTPRAAAEAAKRPAQLGLL